MIYFVTSPLRRLCRGEQTVDQIWSTNILWRPLVTYCDIHLWHIVTPICEILWRPFVTYHDVRDILWHPFVLKSFSLLAIVGVCFSVLPGRKVKRTNCQGKITLATKSIKRYFQSRVKLISMFISPLSLAWWMVELVNIENACLIGFVSWSWLSPQSNTEFEEVEILGNL